MPGCVILGGAPIADYERARTYLRPGDLVVCCDSGLRHAAPLGLRPDLIVGDFDSLDKGLIAREGAEVTELNPVKDDTDSSHALSIAVGRGYDDFLLLGMLGRRMDHSLANLYMLLRIADAGLKALMVDDFAEYFILSAGETAYLDDSLPFFSLINITGRAAGIDITGARYPLSAASIPQAYSDRGISNEVLPGEKARITLSEGRLLVIRDFAG